MILNSSMPSIVKTKIMQCALFFFNDVILLSLDKFNYVHLQIQFQLKFAIF